MLKKMGYVILSLAMILMFSACSSEDTSNSSSAPIISIKEGSNDIDSVVKTRVVKSMDDGDNELFQSITDDPELSIPYVKLGETIQIKFENTAPDSCELQDYILNENGTLKFKQPHAQAINIAFMNGEGSFILHENMLAFASSDITDYKSGAIIRGFKLICNLEESKQEYVFIIRTDAKKY